MPSRRECANAIRALSIDAIEKAGSGHPGAPLGMADMAEALWRHELRHNPENPDWPDRDRFILSNGHASMLLYALLHLTGYDLPIEEIRNFRQWQSKTQGHPERGVTPGVEMTTGPLGQGIASAVGIALAEELLAARFNRPGFEIVNHYTWAFCGDGCLMEGVSHEAAALAGTWGLGKLIFLYDSNGVSIDGHIDPWFDENVGQRFMAYGWQIIGPIDGHSSKALDEAINVAKAEKRKPSLIICNTHIGFGSPRIDSEASHGAPLGDDAASATKKNLGWDHPPFVIPEEIYKCWDQKAQGREREDAWNRLYAEYGRQYPELAAEFARRMAGKLPADWRKTASELLAWGESKKKDMATRVASRHCLDILVGALPEMIGGSADLSGSVGTKTSSSTPLDCKTYNGNYIFYGVREFGMGAIMNGLAIHGGFLPYAGTFLSFTDQARNALRLTAMMKLHVIWVMTHDSIGVGEDGPTHQPVEQIPALRLVPGLNIWRPCDSQETAVAWLSAVEGNTPACLVLSRQCLPEIERPGKMVEEIARGGYILHGCSGKPDIILLATGSEVHLVMDAARLLEESGKKCQVVSMPCTEIFDAQDQAWRDKVLPPDCRCRLAVEAARGDCWGRYVGLDGDIIAMDNYGFSAPGKELFVKFGFTAKNVAQRAMNLIEKSDGQKQAF